MYLLAWPCWCRVTYNLSIPFSIKWSCGEGKQNNKECLGKRTGCTSRGVAAQHWRCSFCTLRMSTFVSKILAIFFNLYRAKSSNSINFLIFCLSYWVMKKNDFFLEKKSEFMDVFPYVSLNWRQHQEGACIYKLKKIKHTCIEWFFCYFSLAHIMQRRK